MVDDGELADGARVDCARRGAVRAFVIRAVDDATAPERGVDTESTVYTDVFRVWIGV